MSDRVFAIGDIHGCVDALRALLDQIKPDSTDTIVTLGDYVDRGPDSAGVLDLLTELVSYCRLVPLLGNHEIMMTHGLLNRRDFEFWVFNGGGATLQSYGGNIHRIPPHHHTFLDHCLGYYETEKWIFVHAAYDPGLPMNEQKDELLFWQHVGEGFTPRRHFSGKDVICGHTPQIEGEIKDLGHIKIIDTFCYGDRWLTALELHSGEILQASAEGKLRQPSAGASNGQAVSVRDAGERTWAFSRETPSPLELDGGQFEQMLHTVGRRLASHLDSLERAIVKNDEKGQAVADELNEPLPHSQTPLEGLLDSLFDKYIPGTFNTASPGYLAYIPGGGLPESGIGDLIASVTNRYITVWRASPALAQIESTVVRWFCEIIGYGADSGGFLASGGSIANLSAIIAARVKLAGDDFSRARIYASDQTHHCVHKAAFIAGFPKANLREISVDSQQGICVEELEAAITQDRQAGFQPLMIVGNAGTTNTGAVDDLEKLADIAAGEGMWFHVDAAYGGFFVLTQRGRDVLGGLARADSVVLDPHKGLFVPYGTGCLLVKRRDDLLPAFQFTSDYMPAMTGDRTREDICEISPELSRANRGLRIWLPIKLHGIDTFAQLLDEKLQLTQWSYEQLVSIDQWLQAEHPKLHLHALQPQLTVVSFYLTHDDYDLQQNNQLNQGWLEQINQSGRVMLTSTTLAGRHINRICIVSFRTHIERMQECLQIVKNSIPALIGGN